MAKCLDCGSLDFYEGMFGPKCGNPKCGQPGDKVTRVSTQVPIDSSRIAASTIPIYYTSLLKPIVAYDYQQLLDTGVSKAEAAYQKMNNFRLRLDSLHGGEESVNFLYKLYAMYRKFIINHSSHITQVGQYHAESMPNQCFIIDYIGYDLSNECGIHRVREIPDTDYRVHTSTVKVSILGVGGYNSDLIRTYDYPANNMYHGLKSTDLYPLTTDGFAAAVGELNCSLNEK